MASNVSDIMPTGAHPLQRQVPEAQTDHGFRTDIRNVIAVLQRHVGDDRLATPPRHDSAAPPRARTFAVLDARDISRNSKESWPRGLVFVLELLALACLLAAIVYGPAYYSCSQMKQRGMFYYGTTVGTCVRDRVSAQHDQLDAFVRQTVRNLRPA